MPKSNYETVATMAPEMTSKMNTLRRREPIEIKLQSSSACISPSQCPSLCVSMYVWVDIPHTASRLVLVSVPQPIENAIWRVSRFALTMFLPDFVPILTPVPVPDPAPIRVHVFGNFCWCLRGTNTEEIQDIYFKFLTLPWPTPGPATATPMHFCRAV